MEMDHKGINQLLLSPLYLFEQMLSTVIPGGIFISLLCLKGNALLRTLWYESPLGYKTKIAAFILLAYVVGQLVKLPLSLIFTLRKQDDISGLPDSWKKQVPEVRKMLKGMVIDGALLSTPGLMDRLSVIKAEGGFCLGP